jgi:hypothetical protein
MNIRENEDYNNFNENFYNNQNREFKQNPSFEENKNAYCTINPNDNDSYINYDQINNANKNKDINNINFDNKNKIEDKDLTKFYLNYNHLNTPGVYENTISYVNTEEEDIDRRSKYRLIDKNKINKSLNNSNFKYNKVNKSLPNIELEKIYGNGNENSNLVDYNLSNRTIKIPKRYFNSNIKSNENYKKFKQTTPEEEEDSRLRILHLLQNFYNFLEESKMDPILDTFKNNDILKEFFVQRILELIANNFDSEKEIYIQKLLVDRIDFESNIKNTQNTYEEVIKITLICKF